MFTTATEGLTGYVKDQTRYSSTFKDFLYRCLDLDPSKRSKPDELLMVKKKKEFVFKNNTKLLITGSTKH